MKCRRAVCNREGGYKHSQTGELYCLYCAIKINRANPEVPNLIDLSNFKRNEKNSLDKK